jgi:hypothetical protein
MRGEWSGPGRITGRGRRHGGLELQVDGGFHLRRITPPFGNHQSLVRIAAALADRHQIRDSAVPSGSALTRTGTVGYVFMSSVSQSASACPGTMGNETQESTVNFEYCVAQRLGSASLDRP